MNVSVGAPMYADGIYANLTDANELYFKKEMLYNNHTQKLERIYPQIINRTTELVPIPRQVDFDDKI